MRFKVFLCVAVSLTTFLPASAWTSSAEAKAVAKDPLAAIKLKSKAATKSTGSGSKYLRVKNQSSQTKKKK